MRPSDSKQARPRPLVLKDELRRRRYQPIPKQVLWLASEALRAVRDKAGRLWHRLSGRGQNAGVSWQRVSRLANRW